LTEQLLEEKVGLLLRNKNMWLTVAESCTGGLVGHRVTNIPGSSDYYLGSVTAYAYEVKESLLGVSHKTLQNTEQSAVRPCLKWLLACAERFQVVFPSPG